MTPPFRTSRSRSTCAALLVVSLLPTLLPRSASAKPNTDQCIDADTQAQDLRRDGKLLSARAALQICTDPACPGLVREDCTQRMRELSKALPSLSFSAKDGAGRALSAVAVTIDGKPWGNQLSSSAIEVDPGEHTFTFQAAGLAPASLKLRLREGEHARREVLLGTPQAERPSSPALTATNDTAEANAHDSQSSPGGNQPISTQRALAWTALGVGATGVVVGSVFGLMSKSKHDDAKACGTTCPDEPSYQANQDAIKFGNVSTVSFIVGALGLAGGVALWLTEKPDHTSSTASAQLGIGLGSLQVRGRF